MPHIIYWIFTVILVSSATLFTFSCLAFILDMFNLIKVKDDVRKFLIKLLATSIIVTFTGCLGAVFNPEYSEKFLSMAQFEETIEELANSEGVIADIKPLLSENLTEPVVYIQFSGSITREFITGLNTKLGEHGWIVPGISGERTEVAIGLNVVRFYGEQDRERATRLAELVSANWEQVLTIEDVSARYPDKRGQIEVWISN